MAQKIRRFEDRLKNDLKISEFKKHFTAYELPVRLALQIAQLRHQKKMTQAALARKINVSQQFIARLENSQTTIPTLRTLEKVAQALDKHLYVDFR